MRPPFAHLARPLASPRGARLLFIFLTLAGLLAFAAAPGLKRTLGLNHFDLWFSDSYAVLAAVDAHRAGLDTLVSNPLDLLDRPHSYTDWWYALGPLGLTRADNFLVGASWVAAFLLVTWLTLRPTHPGAALGCTLLVLSPPVLLALNRANNDLVIFTLLGLAALLLHPRRPWSWLPALALIALATGLKFYPVVGAAVFLLVRPARRLTAALALSVPVLALVLRDVLPDIARGQFPLPPGLYCMGAGQLFRDLGYHGSGVPLFAGLLLAIPAWALVRARLTTGLADDSRDFAPRALFLLGAATLTACFLAGISYGYRWIFSLWLAPWLLATRRDLTLAPSRRRLATATGSLLLLIVWLDGTYCLVTNALVGPMPSAQLQSRQLTWRLGTQPLSWIFFTLLTGWIADALRCAFTTLRTPVHPRSPAPSPPA